MVGRTKIFFPITIYVARTSLVISASITESECHFGSAGCVTRKDQEDGAAESTMKH